MSEQPADPAAYEHLRAEFLRLSDEIDAAAVAFEAAFEREQAATEEFDRVIALLRHAAAGHSDFQRGQREALEEEAFRHHNNLGRIHAEHAPIRQRTVDALTRMGRFREEHSVPADVIRGWFAAR